MYLSFEIGSLVDRSATLADYDQLLASVGVAGKEEMAGLFRLPAALSINQLISIKAQSKTNTKSRKLHDDALGPPLFWFRSLSFNSVAVP